MRPILTTYATVIHVPNVFAGPYLDRVAHRRTDEPWLRAALERSDTFVVPVWQSKSLLCHGPAGTAAAYVEARRVVAGVPGGDLVLLGQSGSATYFALELDRPEPVLGVFTDAAVRFEDLRLAGGQLDAQEAGVLAYARAMLHWRRRHRFCSACGAPTQAASAGHVMKCTNADCGADHFPRLDPAIIVLVTDGERALLGRQASWPAGRYSTIAGFVEPGESLEDAVLREVLEETGVRIESADYHSSQPWPFPASLMIGYVAHVAPGQTPRPGDELEDARWFTRDDLAHGRAGLPPPQSVSFRLIEDWYDAGSPMPLRETPGVMLWGPMRR